jgi:exodeoxyribonuclease V gamma subunit
MRLRACPPAHVRLARDGVVLEDWLDGLRAGNGPGVDADPDDAAPAWLTVTASKVLAGKPPKPGASRSEQLLPRPLVAAWVRLLVAAANGTPVHAVLVGREATLYLAPPSRAVADPALAHLLDAWRDGRVAPLPFAFDAALAWHKDMDRAPVAYEGDAFTKGEVEDEPHLQRVFPDWESISGDGRFEALATRLVGPFVDWLEAQAGGVVRHPGVTGDDENGEGGDDA